MVGVEGADNTVGVVDGVGSEEDGVVFGHPVHRDGGASHDTAGVGGARHLAAGGGGAGHLAHGDGGVGLLVVVYLTEIGGFESASALCSCSAKLVAGVDDFGEPGLPHGRYPLLWKSVLPPVNLIAWKILPSATG